MPEPWDYKRAGLDLEKYAETMAGIQPLLARTWDPHRVMKPPFPPRKGGKGSGGFASLFDLNALGSPARRYANPVLVTCTDGVGSKLKIAAQMGKFDTVGIDLVAMSVNDLICTGGDPLVFLDYIAMPKDDPELSRQLVLGISEGCLQAGCSLVGGETAILPDFYAAGDFDMAGFAAGMAERAEVIDGSAIRSGDALIGIASSGIHSNGYSLVRKVVEAAKLKVTDYVLELDTTVGGALLTPTMMYAKPIRRLLNAVQSPDFAISGLANITGGGIPDNLGRILPPGCQALVSRAAWPKPPLFTWLQKLGSIADAEMERVFNGGIGFVVVCRPVVAESVLANFCAGGSTAWRIGEVRSGDVGVTIR